MLPSDEWCRITHNFTGLGVPTGAAVVYCVHIDASQPVEETATVAHNFFGTIMMDVVVGTVSLVSTIAKEGPDETGASAEVSPVVYPGLIAGAAAPPQTTMLITKNTVAGGRRGRGRMYLPGIEESTVDASGIIASGFFAAAAAALQAWYEALGPGGIPLALEHGPTTHWELVGGQPRRVPDVGAVPDPTNVIGVSLSNKVATQRRRVRR